MRPVLALLLTAPLLAAGCTSAPDDVSAASVSPAVDPFAPVGSPVSFVYDGMIGAAVIACPVVACAGLNDPASDRVTPLAVKGNLTGIAITLTWEAKPTMERLRTGISWGPAGAREAELIEGTSPLVLAIDGLELTAKDDVSYWVWVPTPVPMALVTAAAPQPFHAEGVLTMSGA